MLPQVQVNQVDRWRRNRPRPINPNDNPSTTGQLVNPNGSYVANPTPQLNAYAGPQGQFGANLPQVQVVSPFATAGNGSVNPRVGLGANSVQSYNANAFLSNIGAATQNLFQSYGPQAPITPYLTSN